MERFKILLAFLFFNCSVINSGAQTSNFYRTYSYGGMQGGLAVVGMPDGGFIGTGQHYMNGSQGDCDIYVYRVDACGKLLWLKLIGLPGQEGGKSIRLRNNGNLMITGIYDGSGVVMELDVNGNVIWEKRYNILNWVTNSADLPNGDFVISGFFDAIGSNRRFLARCNPTGSVIWSRELNGMGHVNSSVVVLSNGNILMDGTYLVNNGDLSITAFDQNGNQLWCNAYGSPNGFADGDHQQWGSKLFYDANENKVIAISNTSNLGSDDILVMKIDPSTGSPVWSTIFGGTGSDQSRDIVKIPDGYAIVGNSDGFNLTRTASGNTLSEDMLERDILLFAINDTGGFKWGRIYGGNRRDKGIGLRHNDDGSFLISAYTASDFFHAVQTVEPFDPLFIRTDTSGRLTCQSRDIVLNATVVNMTANPGGTYFTSNIVESPSNSVVNSITPPDEYICLSCVTDPIFVPSDTVVCINEPVSFYNTTTFGLKCYQRWSINGTTWDGGIDTVTYTFDTPGIYPILLYSNCGASTDTFRINIHVRPFPEPAFTVNNNCLHDSTRFNNSSTLAVGQVSSWKWSFGDGTFSNTVSPVRVYDQIGTYPVILSVTSDAGCTKTDTDQVTVFPLPVPAFSTEDVCLSDSAKFNNFSNGPYPISRYQWDFGDSTTSTLINPYHRYHSSGKHFIRLSAYDVHGCKDVFLNEIDIQPLPLPDFDFEPPSCDLSLPAWFKNRSANFVDANWYFGDGDTSNSISPEHLYAVPGSYPVKLVLTSEKGCRDSIVDQYVVIPEIYRLFTPNCFTPNNDLRNDIFYASGEGIDQFKMDIYDRWGNLIFSSVDVNEGWDGTVNGKTSQNDVFVFLINTTDRCGTEHRYSGRVTVLK